MLNFILLLCGFIVYYLAYKSPKTDLILYGMSGVLFILAGLAAFQGYGDIKTGETISYTYTTIDNQTVVESETITPTYSNHMIFTRGLPLIEFLLGLYILIALGVEPKQNARRED